MHGDARDAEEAGMLEEDGVVVRIEAVRRHSGPAVRKVSQPMRMPLQIMAAELVSLLSMSTPVVGNCDVRMPFTMWGSGRTTGDRQRLCGRAPRGGGGGQGEDEEGEEGPAAFLHRGRTYHCRRTGDSKILRSGRFGDPLRPRP